MMPSFLGKTITAEQETRLRDAHKGRAAAVAGEDATPTLDEVAAYYLQAADNEVIYHERAIAEKALPAVTPIGLA